MKCQKEEEEEVILYGIEWICPSQQCKSNEYSKPLE